MILVVTSAGCKKGNKPDENQKQSSKIETLSIQFLNPTKMILTGSITKGDYEITEYGFIYGSTPNLNKENGTVVNLGSGFVQGTFTKEIQDLIVTASKNMFVRAFLIDANGPRYGKELSSERPDLQAEEVSPLSGKTEDRISIKGKFYGAQAKDIVVTFSNVSAKIESVSDTEIIAEIPKGIPEIHGQSIIVNVINKGAKTEMTKDFKILAHIHDYSPKQGAIGSLLSFEADNLQLGRWAPVDVPIFFGDTQAEFSFFDNFHVFVPMNVPGNTTSVYVSIEGVKTKLPGEFTILKPVITDISPKTAVPGTLYRIKGENLPYVPPALPQPTGKLGNKAVVISSNSTEITFTTPLDMPPGEHAFTLDAGPFKFTSVQKVNVLPHQITGMSPASGSIGTSIVLTGTFVHEKTYNVYINDEFYAEIRAFEDGKINFGMNYNTKEEDVDIAVQMGNKMVPAGKFKVIYP